MALTALVRRRTASGPLLSRARSGRPPGWLSRWRVPYAGDVDAARRAEIRAKAGSIIASVLGDEGAEPVVLGARRGIRVGNIRVASPDGSTGLRLDLAYELTSKLNFWPDLVAAATVAPSPDCGRMASRGHRVRSSTSSRARHGATANLGKPTTSRGAS